MNIIFSCWKQYFFESSIHIFAPPCNILYVFTVDVLLIVFRGWEDASRTNLSAFYTLPRLTTRTVYVTSKITSCCFRVLLSNDLCSVSVHAVDFARSKWRCAKAVIKVAPSGFQGNRMVVMDTKVHCWIRFTTSLITLNTLTWIRGEKGAVS